MDTEPWSRLRRLTRLREALRPSLRAALSQLARMSGEAIPGFHFKSEWARYVREATEALPAAPAGGWRGQVGATEPYGHVEIDGVRLAYDDDGDSKDTLVCLHAIGHGARDFEEARRRFRGEFRVIAIDWPGHGRSGVDRQAFGMQRYADLLWRLLDRLAVESAVIVGNSIGAGAGLLYAARHPERVRGLVLESPAGLLSADAGTAAAMRAMSRIFEAGERGAPWFQAFFAAFYRLLLPSPVSLDQRTRIIAAGRESCSLLKEAWGSFPAPSSDLRGVVAQVQAPVLVLWPESDRINPLGRSLDALRRFHDARIEKAPGGHSPHMEAPDEFEAAMRRFLRELPAVARATNGWQSR